jgi:hypothetical protein
MSACSPILARLLACAALALALLPATARAEANLTVPAAEPLMTTAHVLAVARWGMEPCAGQVAVSWTHMGPGINARSQWMSIDAHNPATFTDCTITYNLDVTWDWPKLCTVVEHELGHLAGHDHVDDPHDVMSPYYIFPAPECSPPTTAAPVANPGAARHKATSVISSRHAASTRAAAKRKAAAKRRAAAERKAAAKRKASWRRTRGRSARAPSLGATTIAFPIAGPCWMQPFAASAFVGCVLADAA